MQIGDAVIPTVGMFTDLGIGHESESMERPSRFYSRQRGVIRTNCIDCLDRTNVGQFCVGVSISQCHWL